MFIGLQGLNLFRKYFFLSFLLFFYKIWCLASKSVLATYMYGTSYYFHMHIGISNTLIPFRWRIKYVVFLWVRWYLNAHLPLRFSCLFKRSLTWKGKLWMLPYMHLSYSISVQHKTINKKYLYMLIRSSPYCDRVMAKQASITITNHNILTFLFVLFKLYNYQITSNHQGIKTHLSTIRP